MLLLVLALASGQVPEKPGPVAVLVTSKRAGAEAFAAKLSGRIATIVQQELGAVPMIDSAAAHKRIQASGFTDSKKCQGARRCVAKLALLLGPSAVVVSVDVGRVQKSLAVHLEAVSALGTEPLATGDFTAVTDEWNDQLAVPITVFSRALAQKLKPPPPPRPPEPELKAAPVTEAAPPTVPAPAVVTETAPPPRSKSRVLPIVLIAAGVLIGGGAGAFAAMGNYDRDVISRSMTMLDGRNVSTLTATELQGLSDRGNQRYTIALAAAIGSAVLLALAAVLFVAS